MITARCTLFIEDLMVGGDQVAELLLTWYVAFCTFSAENPRDLGPFADVATLSLSGGEGEAIASTEVSEKSQNQSEGSSWSTSRCTLRGVLVLWFKH